MENAVHNRQKRQFTGTVASIAGLKSVVVVVERRFKHRTYHKFITTSARYMAHDEHNVCKAGDAVVIEECRPMSARKRWRVVTKGDAAAK